MNNFARATLLLACLGIVCCMAVAMADVHSIDATAAPTSSQQQPTTGE